MLGSLEVHWECGKENVLFLSLGSRVVARACSKVEAEEEEAALLTVRLCCTYCDSSISLPPAAPGIGGGGGGGGGGGAGMVPPAAVEPGVDRRSSMRWVLVDHEVALDSSVKRDHRLDIQTTRRGCNACKVEN